MPPYPGRRDPGVIVEAERLVATSIEILKNELVLPAMLSRHGEAEFRGVMGETINIRRPSWIVGPDPVPIRKDRSAFPDGPLNGSGSGVGYQDSKLNEYTIPIKLTDDLYSAFKLTDELLTLDLRSYAEQVLQPQTRSIAEKYEDITASAMRDSFQPFDYPTGGDGVVDASNPDPAVSGLAVRRAILAMRKVLNDRNVPKQGRRMIVGSSVEALLLEDPHLVKASWAGDNRALRDAEVGRLAGFDIATVSTIGEDEIFAFHPSALRLVNMAPVPPAGAPFASTAGAHGLALRYIRDYDQTWAQDRSLMNVYIGIGEILDYATAQEQTEADEENLRQYRGVRAAVNFG